jgi:predicted GIY-YIG superfamily endonuclease
MKTSVVYLLHFHVPYKHARHYLGSTDDLTKRLNQHKQKGQVFAGLPFLL